MWGVGAGVAGGVGEDAAAGAVVRLEGTVVLVGPALGALEGAEGGAEAAGTGAGEGAVAGVEHGGEGGVPGAGVGARWVEAPGQEAGVVGLIDGERLAEGAEVGEAGRAAAGFAGGAQRGKQQADEQGGDRDHHEQLDEGEATGVWRGRRGAAGAAGAGAGGVVRHDGNQKRSGTRLWDTRAGPVEPERRGGGAGHTRRWPHRSAGGTGTEPIRTFPFHRCFSSMGSLTHFAGLSPRRVDSRRSAGNVPWHREAVPHLDSEPPQRKTDLGQRHRQRPDRLQRPKRRALTQNPREATPALRAPATRCRRSSA